jgi:uncharacterized protein (TIGR04255 family)
MIFPASKRVIYDKNTLEEVICQVKFPAVLKISETPVEFQERIRQDFPVLEQKPPMVFPADLLPDLARLLPNAGTVYQFSSRDKIWSLSLYREFLALTCKQYRRWEDFRNLFEIAFNALNNIYSPAFFSRIGLRYRNVIDRSKLGLSGKSWSDLLAKEICGELAADGIADKIEEARREIVIGMGGNQKVRIIHGLFGQSESDKTYVIDADFFNESEVEVANVREQLNAFNRESGSLFRWAITETLHDAMRPNDVC